MPKVKLEFVMQGTEAEAWAVAEALENGAMNRGYIAVNSYVEAETGAGRGLVDQDSESVPVTQAGVISSAPGERPDGVSVDGAPAIPARTWGVD